MYSKCCIYHEIGIHWKFNFMVIQNVVIYAQIRFIILGLLFLNQLNILRIQMSLFMTKTCLKIIYCSTLKAVMIFFNEDTKGTDPRE